MEALLAGYCSFNRFAHEYHPGSPVQPVQQSVTARVNAMNVAYYRDTEELSRVVADLAWPAAITIDEPHVVPARQ